ncbi:DUF1885 family protein [Gorillibacterium sp. sgz500922]|uniref:DUF1885 family protein n=1 Tax=Gorillibacterium sp. sgz500922 TaxID=3446694 RepID=UPI003F66550F
MAQNAYVELVEGSSAPGLTLEELRGILEHYRAQLAETGKQLGWGYEQAAFPYTIEPGPLDGWLTLAGTAPQYRTIHIGLGSRSVEDRVRSFVRISLPAGSTHGDKGKANELSKYLGKKLKAEVHLLNGRTMYFNPRK